MTDTWTLRSSGVTQNIYPIRFGNGVFLGLYTVGGSMIDGRVLRSADGITWTSVDITGPLSSGGPLNDLAYGAGVWIAVGGGVTVPSTVYRSTDNGLTWAKVTGLPPLGGGIPRNAFPDSVAFQSGTWVITGGQNSGVLTSQYMVSTDGGLTWTLPGTFACGFFYTTSMVVDGTNFINPCLISSFPAKIAFSPDGSTWTAISAPPDFQFGPTAIAFGSGVYVSLNGSAETVRVASTLAGLASAADTALGIVGNPPQWIGFGGGSFVVVDGSGNVARSSNAGATWTPGVLNYPAGHQAVSVAFGNGIWVATGLNGDIATLSFNAPPPVALTLPPTLPLAVQGQPYGYTLTPTGGVGPYAWSITAVPNAGSWLRVTNGALTGTPLTQGPETVTIVVVDANGTTASQTVILWALSNASVPYASLITSEHNQKPKFMQLVEVLTGAVGDVTAAVGAMPSAFSLLNGAQGAQLDVLGQWIGQSRVIPGILVAGFFGFSELSSGLPDGLQLPFGELSSQSIGGIWYNLGDTAAGTTTLTDPQYITILKARIARNQSNGTLSAIEKALNFIFGVGCKVADNGTLSLAITVSQPISPVNQSLISGLDILPRPSGVAISSVTYTP